MGGYDVAKTNIKELAGIDGVPLHVSSALTAGFVYRYVLICPIYVLICPIYVLICPIYVLICPIYVLICLIQVLICPM